MTASIFVGNSGLGDDIYVQSGHLATAGDIFADGCGFNPAVYVDNGFNVSNDESCLFGQNVATDRVDSSVGDQLGALSDNGGPTQTVEPLTGNPAIGLIPDTTAGLCPTTDQRGVVSPTDTSCNAGSVQAGSLLPTVVSVTATGTVVMGGSPTLNSIDTTLPNGIGTSGTLTCTTVNGGTPINSSLPVGTYTIDGSGCSGLSLTGAGASAYSLSIVGGTLTVLAGIVDVTVTGTESTFNDKPSFSGTATATLPDGISLSGAVTCATVNGGRDIQSGPALSPGTYTIDASSCSGLSLAGTDASTYSLSLIGGSFVVTPQALAMPVSGSQEFDGLPTFTPDPGYLSDYEDAGFTITGTVTCTTVDGGTKITPLLSVGTYTIDGSNCTGLSPNNPDFAFSYHGGTFSVTGSGATDTVTFNPEGGSAVASLSGPGRHDHHLAGRPHLPRPHLLGLVRRRQRGQCT